MRKNAEKRKERGNKDGKQSGGVKQSTIRKELMRDICTLVAIPMIILGAVTVYLSYRSTTTMMEQNLSVLATVAGAEVEQSLESIRNVAIEAGCVARLSSADSSRDDKKMLIDQRVASHGYTRGNILNVRGQSIFDGTSYADQEYFKQAAEGNAWVSEPQISKTTGDVTVVVAAPIWQDGVPGSTVTGVVCFAPQESFLGDIVTGIKVSENAGAYILDKDGYTIAHKNIENVKNRENTMEDAKTDTQLAALAALELDLTQGNAGFGTYSYGGVTKLLAYAPIGGTNGWGIGINAPTADFMGATYQGILIAVVLIALTILVAIILARKIAAGIGNPVAQCTARLERLAEGDLTSPVPQVRSRNETGRLAAATETITQSISGMIGDLGENLDGIASGDFTVQSKNPALFRGDFSALLESIKQLTTRQSGTMSRISGSADQVAAGSDQVSAGAQALSQGATEQASSVEELAATIDEISIQIKQTAENAGVADTKVSESEQLMEKCDQQMKDMVLAMNEISENSQQIGRIIKTIEDIAFQTNILALNAAVEAARAGEAGKGFAVVADEVRNLAGKSATASKDTAALIEAAVESVGRGAKLATATADTLNSVAENSKLTAEMVDKIAAAAQQQSTSIAQVAMGMEQISSVVQTNSATAEESAAASEEMTAQSQMLKELVSQFKLLEGDQIGSEQTRSRHETPRHGTAQKSAAGKY